MEIQLETRGSAGTEEVLGTSGMSHSDWPPSLKLMTQQPDLLLAGARRAETNTFRIIRVWGEFLSPRWKSVELQNIRNNRRILFLTQLTRVVCRHGNLRLFKK